MMKDLIMKFLLFLWGEEEYFHRCNTPVGNAVVALPVRMMKILENLSGFLGIKL